MQGFAACHCIWMHSCREHASTSRACWNVDGVTSLGVSVCLQVIETYIPEVLSEQSTESNRTLITKWDAETILGSECVADYVMYKPPVSYSSTDFYFVEEALDSNIIAEHLSVHQSTSRLVVQLIQERGFQQDLKQ